MAGSVNKVILVGYVGKKPEIRTFQSGGRVASFSVATSESWKDKQTGEKRERTEWHRISVLNDALVTIVERYIQKGTRLYLEGQLETRKWTDQQGIERFSTEVVLRPYRGEITLVGDSGSKSNRQDGYQAANEAYAPNSNATSDFSSEGAQPDLDDEIPF